MSAMDNTIEKSSFFDIFKDFLTLCKPKVVLLMLITAWVGMLLASDTLPVNALIFGTLGIGLASSAGAAINHLVERHIDIHMKRTQGRPIASGRITPKQALWFAVIMGSVGLLILYVFVNTLTTWLTFLSLFGYALVYTLYLKRATPQNIVIGGAAGASPPLLGFTAVTDELHAYGLILMLIIYTWTPPHFWALAINRYEDYKAADLPMLPITHGIQFTKVSIVLYSILLLLVALLPYLTGLSGLLYLIVSFGMSLSYLLYNTKLLFEKDLAKQKRMANQSFYYSIFYLLILFVVLLLDHYLIQFITDQSAAPRI